MKKLAARDFEDILQVCTSTPSTYLFALMLVSLGLVFHPCVRRTPYRTVQWDVASAAVQSCRMARSRQTQTAH